MKKMWVRIIVDFLIIVFFLSLIIGARAVIPPRMEIYIKPEDLGLKYENIILKTEDGKILKGWLIYSEKSKGIIICLHGYPANKSDILPVVEFLYPEFSLLFFDFRAHGESQGKVCYFGLKEFLDVKSAIEFIKNDKRLRDLPIGIWGYSFGGAVAIISSAKYSEIKAIVTDSAFANFPDMVRNYYKNLGPLKYIFSTFSIFLGKYVFKKDFRENSPENFIDKVKCPILIIHSKNDEFVPFSHAERLYKKANQPKELYIVEGPHTGLDRAYTREYREKVKNFFINYLLYNKKEL
ncbi:MAG: alpha/beta fold hydrolase [Candidatus Omnitrophica bacterium]|nr:alpha/beta fold hydrolase [Candidatus Omnitrophota bacterium]MCM8807390.1 alpha/beta fold hydrolase [Candidatus Omnitrophota bacterium]